MVERLAKEDLDEMRVAVREGIASAIKDDELVKRFWHTGFDHLSGHAGRAGTQWVGQRIATAFVVAVVSAGIAWLVKTGKI